MKKFFAILLTVILLLSVTACAGTAEKSADNEVRIGIAAPDVTHGWVAGVAYYAEKYCKEKNITYKVTTSSDAAEMSASIDDLIAWKADVIVIYPQWTGMESTVQSVIDSGVPVVSFDVDIDAEGIYKVTGDNYGMGWESAKYILSRVGDAAHIAVLDNPSSGSVAGLRLEGFYAYLESVDYDTSNVFEVACSEFTREEGLTQMSDILNANDTVDAVFSTDDELSIGSVQAIEEAGRKDIKAVTGGGGMQEYFKMIADESYADMGLSTALYSPMMIEDAIDTAITICSGEKPESLVTIETTVVTSENVASYLDPSNTIY